MENTFPEIRNDVVSIRETYSEALSMTKVNAGYACVAGSNRGLTLFIEYSSIISNSFGLEPL